MSDLSQLLSGVSSRTPRARPFLRRLLIAAAAGVAVLFVGTLPWVPRLEHHNPTTTAFMELRQKQAQRKHQHLDSQMVWRDLGAISPNLVHAVLLAEDDRFYEHHGFDFEEIAVAIRRDWEEKKYVYGGSTITQQLARTLYLSPKKSLIRKLREAAITVWMELCLRKKRILEVYLNVVEWGPGIYGAEAASQYYYHKSADALTPDEAVALASILPSPRRWSPMSEKAFMARRRTRLYLEMQAAGYAPPDLSTATPDAVMDPDQLLLPANDSPAPEN